MINQIFLNVQKLGLLPYTEIWILNSAFLQEMRGQNRSFNLKKCNCTLVFSLSLGRAFIELYLGYLGAIWHESYKNMIEEVQVV